MRATGAEIGRPNRGTTGVLSTCLERAPGLRLCIDAHVRDVDLIEQRLDRSAYVRDRELADRRQQRRASQILFAGEGRPPICGNRIEMTCDLILHHGTLFLDDEQCTAALRERAQAFAIHRPDEARLVEANTEAMAGVLIETE